MSRSVPSKLISQGVVGAVGKAVVVEFIMSVVVVDIMVVEEVEPRRVPQSSYLN